MPYGLFHFLVGSVVAAGRAELLELKPVLVFLLIFRACIIAVFALATL